MFIMMNKSMDKRNQYGMISIFDIVANSHLLRKVDAILDLYFVYELVEGKYCLDNGKLSIDPVILVNIIQVVFIIQIYLNKYLRK